MSRNASNERGSKRCPRITELELEEWMGREIDRLIERNRALAWAERMKRELAGETDPGREAPP